MAQLADLIVAGETNAAIGAQLGRTEVAIELRRRRILCPIDGNKPAWGKRPYGDKTYWTRERTIAGLQDFARKHRGQLPNSDHEYSLIKRGHMEWPTAVKALEYFGSMAGGWEAAGVSRKRYTRGWNEWSDEDDEYLLEHAGEQTLKIIGAYLGRSWSACKRRLYNLGAGRARDVPGWLSAMQVAKEYGCPVHRVQDLIQAGTLPAFKVKGGHYWRINPIDCDHIRHLLKAPKKTHKTFEPDIGDYRQRYGIRRLTVHQGANQEAAAS